MALIVAAILAAPALAQDITFLAPAPPDFTPAYAGSVVSACAETTVLAIACTASQGFDADVTCDGTAPVSPSHHCGLPMAALLHEGNEDKAWLTHLQTNTYTIGASFLEYQSATAVEGVSVTVDMDCIFTGTATAVCVESVDGSGNSDFATAATTTLAASQIMAQVAAITAGAEILNSEASCGDDVVSCSGGCLPDE